MGLMEKAKEQRLIFLNKRIDVLLAEKDMLLKKQAAVSKESIKHMHPSYQNTYRNINNQILVVNNTLNKIASKMTRSKWTQIHYHKAEGVMEIRGFNAALFSKYLHEKEGLINLQKQKSFIESKMDKTVDLVKYNYTLKIIKVLDEIKACAKEVQKI